MVLHLRAQGLEEEDQHPPTLCCGAWLTLPLPSGQIIGQIRARGTLSPPFPFPLPFPFSLPLLSLHLPFLPFPSLPLEVGPIKSS